MGRPSTAKIIVPSRMKTRIVLACMVLSSLTMGIQSFSVCSLANVGVQKITKDTNTGEYVFVLNTVDEASDDGLVPTIPNNNNGNDNDNGDIVDGTNNNRLLRMHVPADSIVNAIRITQQEQEQQQEGDDNNYTGEEEMFYVRQCSCFTAPERFYCPSDTIYCAVNHQPLPSVTCFNESTKVTLIRNAWPVVVLWYGALFLFLVVTKQGRHALHYVYFKCCSTSYNATVVNRILQPTTARGRFGIPFPWGRTTQPNNDQVTLLEHMRSIFAVRLGFAPPGSGEDGEDSDSDRTPTELILKTKRYVRPPSLSPPLQQGSSSHTRTLLGGDGATTTTTTAMEQSTKDHSHEFDDDDDEVSCAICFAGLEDGDRIGALPCDHIFHVDCLKSWLIRRNVCPLCQSPNVAAPRYRPRNNAVPVDLPQDENSLLEGVFFADHTDADPPTPQADQEQTQTRSSGLSVSDTFSGNAILQRSRPDERNMAGS